MTSSASTVAPMSDPIHHTRLLNAPLERRKLAIELFQTITAPDYNPPRLPAVATRLIGLTWDDVDLKEILRLLQQDQLLTARVLKIAQSPVYSGVRPIRTLKDAVVRLGLNTVRDVVIQAALFIRVFNAGAYTATLANIQRHCVATAHTCASICKHGRLNSDGAFLAGLLHDVGFASLLLVAGDKPEDELLPLDELLAAGDEIHAACSGLLAKFWELPEHLYAAVNFHHIGLIEDERHFLASLVCVAEDVVNANGIFIAQERDVSLPEHVEACRDYLGLNDTAWERVQQDAVSLQEQLESLV